MKPEYGALAILAVVGMCKAGAFDRSAAGERGHDAGKPTPRSPSLALTPVAAADVCVTHGHLDGDGDVVHVTEPTFRAVAPATEGDGAALRFTYLGPTLKTRALASGDVRHQVGLKLRAADGCNLVYVMWRLEPRPQLEVSVKHNPGAHDNAACGVGGYVKIAPRRAARVKRFALGSTHTLQAEIVGDDLVAWIDGEVAWQGTLDGTAAGLTGPVGMRSDNLELDLELSAAAAADGAAVAPPSTCAVATAD